MSLLKPWEEFAQAAPAVAEKPPWEEFAEKPVPAEEKKPWEEFAAPSDNKSDRSKRLAELRARNPEATGADIAEQFQAETQVQPPPFTGLASGVQAPEERGFFPEAGHMLARGGIELEGMAGNIARAVAPEGSAVADWGKRRQLYSDAVKEHDPFFAPSIDPEKKPIQAGLTQGAAMVIPSMAVPAAIGLAAPVAGIGAGAAAIGGGLAGAAAFGLSQGQETFERGVEAGLSPEDARAAAIKSGVIEGAGESIGNLFGPAKWALRGGRPLRQAAVKLIKDLSTRQGVKEVARKAAWDYIKTAGAETLTEEGQQIGERIVDITSGIDKTPITADEIFQTALATIGMTTFMAQLGLAGHVQQAQANNRISKLLQDGAADPASRLKATQAVAEALKTEDPRAAAIFVQKATEAIRTGQSIALDGSALEPTAAAQPVNPDVAPVEDNLDYTMAAPAAEQAVSPEQFEQGRDQLAEDLRGQADMASAGQKQEDADFLMAAADAIEAAATPEQFMAERQAIIEGIQQRGIQQRGLTDEEKYGPQSGLSGAMAQEVTEGRRQEQRLVDVLAQRVAQMAAVPGQTAIKAVQGDKTADELNKAKLEAVATGQAVPNVPVPPASTQLQNTPSGDLTREPGAGPSLEKQPMEVQNAAQGRIGPERNQQQYPGTQAGAAIPADQEEVRQEAGAEAGRGGGVERGQEGAGQRVEPEEYRVPEEQVGSELAKRKAAIQYQIGMIQNGIEAARANQNMPAATRDAFVARQTAEISDMERQLAALTPAAVESELFAKSEKKQQSKVTAKMSAAKRRADLTGSDYDFYQQVQDIGIKLTEDWNREEWEAVVPPGLMKKTGQAPDEVADHFGMTAEELKEKLRNLPTLEELRGKKQAEDEHIARAEYEGAQKAKWTDDQNDLSKPGVGVPVRSGDLIGGDTFRVKGQKITVAEKESGLQIESGNIVVLELPYETMTGDELVYIDKDSLKHAEAEPKEAPGQLIPEKEMPFNLVPEKRGPSEAELAKRDREEAQRKEKAKKDKLAELAQPLPGVEQPAKKAKMPAPKSKDKGRPEPGKQYSLHEISKGKTWAEAEVKPAKPEVKSPTANLSDTDQAELKALQDAMRKKLLGQVGMGLDPEVLTIGAKMAALYVKGGTKTFSQFATNMKADMADIWDRVKVYLHSIWQAAGATDNTLDDISRADAAKIVAELEKPAEVTPEEKPKLPPAKTETPAGAPGMEIVEQFYTKRGHNVYIVTMADRVSSDKFKAMAREARTLGGKWSPAWKPTKSPAGFMFNRREQAEAFMNGQVVEKPKVPKSQSEIAKAFQEGGRGAVLPERSRALAAAEEVAHDLMFSEGMTFKDLSGIVAKHMGGTLAEGKFTVRDAYDIVELAVNQMMFDTKVNPAGKSAEEAIEQIKKIRQAVLDKIPTPSMRTGEQDKFQQFSTPPHISFVANWAANLQPNDAYLEPSAGLGGLAVFGKIAGVKQIIANELSDIRANLLDRENIANKVYRENAEHLSALLEPKIASGEIERPTVVVMNPPFSSAAELDKKTTHIGAKHIEEALKLLAPGGRLVAITGQGMAADRPKFKDWWSRISREYSVRANIGINGDEFKKYGTTFGIQLLVIDKPATGQSADSSKNIVNSVDKLEDSVKLLLEVRNERVVTTESTPAESGSGAGTQETASGAGERGNATADAGIAQPAKQPGRGPGKSGKSGGQPGGSLGELFEQPARPKGSSEAAGSGVGTGGRAGDESVGIGGTSNGYTGSRPAGRAGAAVEVGIKDKVAKIEAGEGEIFAEYIPAKVDIPGSQPHPTPLVESVANSAVDPLDPTYKPIIAKELITSGALTLPQLEQIVYAGQAHETLLPDGRRKGYFIGDGTGVGKGREISGIFLDNYNHGRRKAIWVSKTENLINDAKRDITDLGVDGNMLLNIGKSGGKGLKLHDQGIAFVTYSSLSKGNPGVDRQTGKLVQSQDAKKSRIEMLYDWLGPDFDGVIIFDEAHLAGNAIDIQGSRGTERASARGRTVVDIQTIFPNARVVYSSATGATDITNLSYAERLGIWGSGTSFANKGEFFNKIMAAGMSGLEIVSRDLKALGTYLARTLSFKGVSQSSLRHELTKEQRDIYDEVSRAWQMVASNIDETMAQTGANNNGQARGRARSAFYGAEQRFYNQLLTALQMPTVIADMRKELDGGGSVVLQLVNTNEASLNRGLAEAAGESDEEGKFDIEQLDLSPKDILLRYVSECYPTQLYEPVQDDKGNVVWRPVLDSEGKPVQDPQALAKRQELLDKLAMLKAPSNPLEMILDTFGADNVAEVTGRSRRVVLKKNEETGAMERKLESSRSEAIRKMETQQFQDGKRRILVFSDAGGTGFSYHSSARAKNQQRRIHYLIQAGWRADGALQGMGRTHRADEVVPPFYKLVSTDIKGHERFISTIARRLAQLGSLVSGERKAAGAGLFDETHNLESQYAEDSVLRLFQDVFHGNIEGFDMDLVARKLGLIRTRIDPETGEMVVENELVDPNTGQLNLGKIPTIQQFLNRILMLEVDEQNRFFDEFMRRLDARIENAKMDGSFDPGTQMLRGDEIRTIKDDVVYEHPGTTAKTRIVDIEVDNKTKPIPFDDILRVKPLAFVVNKKSNKIYAIKECPSRTDESGRVHETYRRAGTQHQELVSKHDVEWKYADSNYKEVEDQDKARAAWEKEIAGLPKFHTQKQTYLVGTFLPIWDRIGVAQPKVWRVKPKDGDSFLGIHIPPKMVPEVRRRMNAGRTGKLSPADAFSEVYEGDQILDLANGWQIRPSRIQGEKRIEVVGVEYGQMQEWESFGGIIERIRFTPRFFIPTDPEVGIKVIEKILKKSPVVEGDGTKFSLSEKPESTEPGGELFEQLRGELEAATGEEYSDEAVRAHVDAAGGWPEEETKFTLGEQEPNFTAQKTGEAIKKGDRVLRNGVEYEVVYEPEIDTLPRARVDWTGKMVATVQIINKSTGKPWQRIRDFPVEELTKKEARFSIVQVGGVPGLSRAEVIDAVNAVSDLVGPVIVLQSEDEIPAAVRNQEKFKEYAGRIEGFEHNGEIYLVADHLTDARHAQAKAFHEAFHAGFKKALTGEQRNKILNATFTKFGRMMELAAIARKYDLDLAIDKDYERAMEELFAKITQERKSKPQVWKRFVGAIRQALRDMGLLKTMSDEDIDYLIERALEARANKPGRSQSFQADNATITAPGVQPAFSLAAYHGTPHTFEPEPKFPLGRFKKEKVGTGEGAAAYGWGVAYVAEAKETAEWYKDTIRPSRDSQKLSPSDVSTLMQAPEWPDEAPRYVLDKYATDEETFELSRRELARYDKLAKKTFNRTPLEEKEFKKLIQKRNELFEKSLLLPTWDDIEGEFRAYGVENPREVIEKINNNWNFKTRPVSGGNLYHVEIDADPADFLDWDKPLSAQSATVRHKLFMDYGAQSGYTKDPTGEQIYHDIARTKGVDRMLGPSGKPDLQYGPAHIPDEQAASEYLASLGIKGIRYADQKSRPAVQPRDPYMAQDGKRWVVYDAGGTNEQWFDSQADAEKHLATLPKAERRAPTFNYVVFNESDIRVVGRNGQVLTPTAAMDEEGAKFSLKDKVDKTGIRDTVRGNEAEEAYNRARVDELTGQRSLLGERWVSRDAVNRIAQRSAECYNDWSRLDDEMAQPVSSAPGVTVNQAVGVDAVADVKLAIDKGVLPEIDLTRLGFNSQADQSFKWPWDDLQKSSKLKLISRRTGEALVFKSPDEKVVYKLYPAYRIKTAGNKTFLASNASIEESPEGGLVAIGALGTLGNLIERFSIHNALGGIPTEIVGASRDGVVIVKQPYAETELNKRMGKIGAINRARLTKIPRNAVDYIGSEPAYVAVVNDVPYVVMDVRNENLGLDTEFRERLIDPSIGRIDQRLLADRPALARIVEEARKKEVKQGAGNRVTNWSLADKPAAPVWYSRLERAVASVKMPKMSLDQLAAATRQNVDAEERQWTGFDEWIEEKRKAGVKSVTKDEALAFVRENAVQVQEVTKVGAAVDNVEVVRAKGYAENWMIREKEGGRVIASGYKTEDEARADIESVVASAGTEAQTKFASYQTPGGEGAKFSLTDDSLEFLREHVQAGRLYAGVEKAARDVAEKAKRMGLEVTFEYVDKKQIEQLDNPLVRDQLLSEGYTDEQLGKLKNIGGIFTVWGKHERYGSRERSDSSAGTRTASGVPEPDTERMGGIGGQYGEERWKIILFQGADGKTVYHEFTHIADKVAGRTATEQRAKELSGRMERGEDVKFSLAEKPERFKAVRTLAQLKADPRVELAEADEDGKWIYLKDGWYVSEDGTHAIREDTWGEAITRFNDYVEKEKTEPSTSYSLSDKPAPDSFTAELMQMLDKYAPLVERAAGTGYAVGKAEGKAGVQERIKKTGEKMRSKFEERMEKVRQQAEEKREKAVMAARMGERAKGRKEGIKEGIRIGLERGEETGRTLGIEDTIKIGFAELAREYKSRYLDKLQEIERLMVRVERAGEIIDAEGKVTGTRTPEQTQEAQDWSLGKIFGAERYREIRRVAHRNNRSVVMAVRETLHKELSRHYLRELGKLLRNTGSNKVQKFLPQYRDAWLKEIEGLTPESYTPALWEEARKKYETLTEIKAASMSEQYLQATARRGDADAAGMLAAEELRENVRVIPKSELGTPRRRNLVKNWLVDKAGVAITRALGLSGGDENSIAYEVLYKTLKMADTAARQFEAETVKPVTDLLKSLGITEFKVIDWRTRIVPTEVGGETVLMTAAEKMELAAALEDPETNIMIGLNGWSLERRKGQLEARILGGTPGQTLDMANEVVNTLTADQKRIVKLMVDQLTAMGKEGNKVSTALEGWEKFTKERYWPRKVDRSTTPQTVDLDARAHYAASLKNIGFAKERVASTHPVMTGDIFATFYEHAHMMSKYAKLSLAVHDANVLLGHPVFADEIRLRLGTGYIQDTRLMLQNLSGLRGYKDMSGIHRFADMMTRNVAVSILWFRATSIIFNRYGGSLLAFTELLRNNPAAAMRFMVRAPMPIFLNSADGRQIVEILMQNGYMADRWGHDMAHIYSPLPHDRAGDTSATKFKMRWRKMQEWGMRPMANAEMRNMVAVYKALVKSGVSSAEAVQTCEDITRATQNPSTALEESAAYSAIKSASLGWMFPFLGQPMVSRNLVMRDAILLKNAVKSGNNAKKRHMAACLTATIMGLVGNVALEQAVRAMLRKLSRPPPDDEPEENKDAMYVLMDSAASLCDYLIPGTGKVMDGIKTFVSGRQPRDASFIGGIISKSNSGLRKVTNPYNRDDEYDPVKMEKGITDLLEAAGNVVGGPVGGPLQYYRVARNLMRE